MLDQITQGASLFVVGMPGLEPVAVLHQQLGRILSVSGIVLGPGGREGFPILSQGSGVDGVDDQEVKLQKREQQRAARLLQAYGNPLSRVTSTQAGKVLGDRLWRVWQDLFGLLPGRCVEQTKVVLFVGPVDTEASCILV